MSDNNTTNPVLSPEDSMPDVYQDTDAQLNARVHYGEKVVARVLNPKKKQVFSRGTVDIHYIDEHGNDAVLVLPLKSISASVANEISAKHLESIQDLPTRFNDEGQLVMDDSSTDLIKHSAVIQERRTNIYYDTFVEGYDGEIFGLKTEEIVWSSTDPSLRDREAAVATLKEYGFTLEHLEIIYKKISELSGNAIAEDVDDLKKTSEQPTESPGLSTENGAE